MHLLRKGKVDEALARYRPGPENKSELRSGALPSWRGPDPAGAGGRSLIGFEFQKVLEINPDSAEAHYSVRRDLRKRRARCGQRGVPKGAGNRPHLCRSPFWPWRVSTCKGGRWMRRWRGISARHWRSSPEMAEAHNDLGLATFPPWDEAQRGDRPIPEALAINYAFVQARVPIRHWPWSKRGSWTTRWFISRRRCA